MEVRRNRASTSVRTEGGLLPSDLLAKIAAVEPDVPGLKDADFGLPSGQRFREAITRSWNRLIGAWAALEAVRVGAEANDPLVGATRDRFLMPLFEELGFGRLPVARAVEIEGSTYPISHSWEGRVPVHLVGYGVDLDSRSRGVRGAAGAAPHALLQEFLNRADAALWGIVANGRTLRLLRDSTSLTRQAYVEFDLEAIFTGELYADFALLWSVCHRSRFEGARPEDCLLERWTKKAAEDGIRALDKLRDGVQKAIETLGAGFLAHPANGALRDALRSGALDRQDYYRELLRLVYRLIFLFTAEDRRHETTGRELLLNPAAPDDAVERYRRYYSTVRLRSLASRRRGTRHADVWVSLRRVMEALGSGGALTLALPALGSFLFGSEACPHLDGADLRNDDLLDAVRALATIEEDRRRRPVDYRNLGAEEFGSVYEGLLELHPRIELDANPPRFTLGTAAGNERKATGSYYTPTSLINCLLDSALDPVVEEAVRGKSAVEAEQAILGLAVVDPAAGSGHFLVAVAHRLAKRLAAARTGEGEPAPTAVRHAMRDVIAHCIYAVDINPMAVELCKVSLWLEALEPGRPLSFIDAHIKTGNSLLGTTPELVPAGIPDAAFEAITGDDKAVAKAWRDRNRQERDGQQTLFEAALQIPTDTLALEARTLDALPEDTPDGVVAKAAGHEAYLGSPDYRRARAALDAWCAAFVVRKVSAGPVVTTAAVRALGTDPSRVPAAVRDLVATSAVQYAFFHWPLEFPAVFANGGFDVVVGNPPWIAHAGRAAVPLPPPVHHFLVANDAAFAGYRSTHGLFVHLASRLLRIGGRLGIVVPTSLSDLDGYRPARAAHDRLCRVLAPLTDFGDGMFPGVFMPCMALASERIPDATEQPGEPWILERPDLDLIAAGLLSRLSTLTRFPPEMFGERGIQTTPELRAAMAATGRPQAPFTLPIREGEDVREFELRSPRLYGDPHALAAVLRSPEEYQQVDIVVRQTARFYIAARNDGVAFRNSLLAVFCQPGWSVGTTLALLNSRLLRWFHYQRNRDARQGMPQVKIGHLRALPMPPRLTDEALHELDQIGTKLAALNVGIGDQDRLRIDELVFQAYGLDGSQRAVVEAWST